MEVREVTYAAVALRIAVAFVLGGTIGLERGLKNRPAGLRTYMLVCVGACLIMLTNQYIYQAFGTGDPVRMGSQVVSGIGFLGAGTIIVTKHNQIRGLTTAAGLWAAAAVGLAVGIGFYEAAIVGSCAIFIVLTVMHGWDNMMHRNSRHVEVYFELDDTINLGVFLRKMRELDVAVESLQMEHDDMLENGIRAYVAILKSKGSRKHEILFENIRAITGVVYVEEL